MTATTQRYVRNTRTGVIYPFTPALGKHKHCVVLSLDLGAEYERRAQQGPAAVREMEQRLQDAEASGEPVSADDLASALQNTPETPVAPTGGNTSGPAIPEDFDLGIDLSTLGKPELTAIAKKLNFPIPSGTKVADIRKLLSDFLEETKGAQAQANPADADADAANGSQADAGAADNGSQGGNPDDDAFLQ